MGSSRGIGSLEGGWSKGKGRGFREGLGVQGRRSSLNKNPQYLCNNPKYSFFYT